MAHIAATRTFDYHQGAFSLSKKTFLWDIVQRMKPAGGERPIKSGAVMNGALNVQISAFDLNASCRFEMHMGATQITSLIKAKAVKSVIL